MITTSDIPELLKIKSTKKVLEAFRNSLLPLTISAQILNAAPFPIKVLSSETTQWSTRLKLGIVLQSLCSVFFIGISVASLVYKRSWQLDDMDTPFITYILYNIEIILGLLTCSIIYISCQWRRPRCEEILNHMVDIAIEFEKFGEEQDLSWLRYQFSKCILAGMFYFFITILFDATYYWNVVVTVCTTGAYYIPSAVQFLSLLQYAYVIVFAYRKSKAINAMLFMMRFSLRSNFKSYCPIIRSLRKQHMLLHRLVFKVNRYFGFLIILVVFSVLITISVTCLEIYQHTYIEAITMSTFQYLIYSTLWLLMYVCKLLLIIIPNHLMIREREQTESILQELPSSENMEFTNEISVFVRQLLHHKGPYTAKGVFSLDLTLLTHMFGALITYLVILIQFDQSSRKASDKQNLF